MNISLDINNNMRFNIDLPREIKDITNYIANGELKAKLDLRDEFILSYT